MTGAAQRRWLLRVATVGCGLVLTAALLADDYDPARLAPAWRLVALLGLTACAMGVRNATVRRLGVPDLTTTGLTLTLTGLGADSAIAGGTSPRSARRTLAVAALFAGAASGARFVQPSGLALPLALTGLVVLGATLGYAWHPASLRSAEGAHAH